MTEGFRTIPLTQGQVAIVDAADYEWLSQWKWCAAWHSRMHSFYAMRSDRRIKDHPKTIWMHRQILGLHVGGGLTGDHVNPAATLDNRRSNLRIATISQNRMNARTPCTNTSGFRGVHFNKRSQKWTAKIGVDRTRIFLGCFTSAENAFDAYCKAAQVYHGTFARTR